MSADIRDFLRVNMDKKSHERNLAQTCSGNPKGDHTENLGILFGFKPRRKPNTHLFH